MGGGRERRGLVTLRIMVEYELAISLILIGLVRLRGNGTPAPERGIYLIIKRSGRAKSVHRFVVKGGSCSYCCCCCCSGVLLLL